MLLDLNLPDGDGLDVCRELQRRSDVPILMLTARGTETDKIIGLGLGADDYVVKPFSGDEVIARIRAILRRSERNGKPAATSHIGDLEVDPGARRAVLPWQGAVSDPQGVRPARAPRSRRRPSRDARGSDVGDLGHELVRVDQDARRAHRLAAQEARRRSRQAPLHPHCSGGRLSLRLARGGHTLSLRVRLLLALAYVLVLAIVALEVPLALQLSRRVDAEVRSQATSQADVVAATAAQSLRRPETARL